VHIAINVVKLIFSIATTKSIFFVVVAVVLVVVVAFVIFVVIKTGYLWKDINFRKILYYF